MADLVERLRERRASDPQTMRRRHWWSTATTGARLVQVRAGAEAGLTRKDVSAILGTTRNNLTAFAEHHGISFPDARRGPRVAARAVDEPDEPERLGVEPLDKLFARVGL